jgi:ATP-binding protein involved in chromosome partitioning
MTPSKQTPGLTETKVLDALRAIQDPDLHKDIVSLGFVKNLVIDTGRVSFDIELTTPACPVKEQFQTRARELVGALEGVSAV